MWIYILLVFAAWGLYFVWSRRREASRDAQHRLAARRRERLKARDKSDGDDA